MNAFTDPAHLAIPAEFTEALAAQRAHFEANRYPSYEQRVADLKQVVRLVADNQQALVDAVNADYGCRSSFETSFAEIAVTLDGLQETIKSLRKWMKPQKRHVDPMRMPLAKARLVPQPVGVVGIVVPWNFPLAMVFHPLTCIFAAGNTAMVKMSENSNHTARLLKQLAARYFPPSKLCFFEDGGGRGPAFTSLPFDHIFFTGSPATGKAVMANAARNLTPVTLELGGKSPALVTRGYSLAEAARRITHGKATNAGQICVAPDYALVPREGMAQFVAEAKATFSRLFGGSVATSHDYTAIVNDRQAARIQALLDDARDKGATIEACGQPGPGRRMPLHIVTGLTPDMRLMHEEIFGPVLPVLPYDQLDDALAHINAGPRPLALYCFGHDAAERQRVLRQTHSGGVTINDWGWHTINHDAPFGGVGNSGMGTYHGVEGFRELSHAKTVFKRHRFFPISLFYPPYGNLVQRLTLKFFLGEADPTLSSSPAPGRKN